jgi:hypothetical protein
LNSTTNATVGTLEITSNTSASPLPVVEVTRHKRSNKISPKTNTKSGNKQPKAIHIKIPEIVSLPYPSLLLQQNVSHVLDNIQTVDDSEDPAIPFNVNNLSITASPKTAKPTITPEMEELRHQFLGWLSTKTQQASTPKSEKQKLRPSPKKAKTPPKGDTSNKENTPNQERRKAPRKTTPIPHKIKLVNNYGVSTQDSWKPLL